LILSIFFQAVLKISDVNAAVSPEKIPFTNSLQIDYLKVSQPVLPNSVKIVKTRDVDPD
jgi:hypothetical protein